MSNCLGDILIPKQPAMSRTNNARPHWEFRHLCFVNEWDDAKSRTGVGGQGKSYIDYGRFVFWNTLIFNMADTICFPDFQNKRIILVLFVFVFFPKSKKTEYVFHVNRDIPGMINIRKNFWETTVLVHHFTFLAIKFVM